MSSRQPELPTALPQAERLVALGLLVVSVLAVMWVLAAQPPIGLPSQYHYPYRPAPHWGAVGVLALLGLPLAAPLAWVLVRRRPIRRVRLLAALITVGSVALHMGTAHAPKHYPGAEAAWRFLWSHTEGMYMSDARGVRSVGGFLRDFQARLDASVNLGSPHRVHLDTHPPGLALSYVALERFYDAFPALGRWVERLGLRVFPSVRILEGCEQAFSMRHPLAIALTMAQATILLAALAPLVCYAAARHFWPPERALVAAGLSALVPGIHMFNPSFDQAFATISLVLCLLAARAVATRRWGWGAAFGLAFYAAALVHVGFGLVALFLALAGLLAWRAACPQRTLKELARAYGPAAAAALAAFLGLALLLRLATGYRTFPVIWACLRNNRVFYQEAGRGYWPWVLVTPLEFSVSLGFSLALVAGCGGLLELVGAARRRSWLGRSALLLAIVALAAAVDALGLTRGETARLWLFLAPLFVLGAVDYTWRRLRAPRRLLAVVAAGQALQLVCLSIAVDAGFTTTFLTGLLKHP